MAYVDPPAPSAGNTGEIADLTHVYADLPLFLQKSDNLASVSDTGTARSNIHVPVLTPAAFVATANISSLTGNAAVDGYTPAATDLGLLTAQSTASQNGLWLIPTGGGAWTRPTEFPAGAVVHGRTCRILNGTVYAGSDWTLQSPTAGVTIGTTSQTWIPMFTPATLQVVIPTIGVPPSTLGLNGDYAVDFATQLYYGPKTAGSWPAGIAFGTLGLIPGNFLTMNQQDIETSAAGWSANVNCSVAQTTAQAFSGTHSLSMTATAGGEMYAFATPNFAVTVGNTYTMSAYFRSAVTPRTCGISLNWYTSGLSFISGSTEMTVTDATSGWSQATGSVVAPATAAFATFNAHILPTPSAPVTSEVHYIDHASVQ